MLLYILEVKQTWNPHLGPLLQPLVRVTAPDLFSALQEYSQIQGIFLETSGNACFFGDTPGAPMRLGVTFGRYGTGTRITTEVLVHIFKDAEPIRTVQTEYVAVKPFQPVPPQPMRNAPHPTGPVVLGTEGLETLAAKSFTGEPTAEWGEEAKPLPTESDSGTV